MSFTEIVNWTEDSQQKFRFSCLDMGDVGGGGTLEAFRQVGAANERRNGARGPWPCPFPCVRLSKLRGSQKKPDRNGGI